MSVTARSCLCIQSGGEWPCATSIGACCTPTAEFSFSLFQTLLEGHVFSKNGRPDGGLSLWTAISGGSCRTIFLTVYYCSICSFGCLAVGRLRPRAPAMVGAIWRMSIKPRSRW